LRHAADGRNPFPVRTELRGQQHQPRPDPTLWLGDDGFAYTRAVFRDGLFSGHDVPLVSRWTGNVGVSWDIWQKWLTFDGVVRFVGARRMDNDQLNIQPMIPASTVVDVRFGGEYDRYFWSFAVQNLFNANYFDYAIAS